MKGDNNALHVRSAKGGVSPAVRTVSPAVTQLAAADRDTASPQRAGSMAGRRSTAAPVEEAKNLNQLRYNQKSTKLVWEDVSYPQRAFYVLDDGALDFDVEAPWLFEQLRKLVSRLGVILTIIQTLSIIISYEPGNYDGGRNSIFVAVNIVCTVFFTVDLVARVACAPKRLEYALTPLNIIEFFGLVPFWIDFISKALPPGLSEWLLVLRVARLVRFLLLMEVFEVIYGTIAESSEIATLFLMIVAIVLPSVGTTVYYAERGVELNATNATIASNGSALDVKWLRECDVGVGCVYQSSPFQYASDGMWLAMTTVTTLGLSSYAAPMTTLGKFIMGACMVCGVLILAFPVMILSVNFGSESDRLRLRNLKLGGRRCAYLQALQRDYAKQLDFDTKKKRKSFVHRESIAFGDPTAMLLIPARTRPIYFHLPEEGVYREAILFQATEVRYDPLLIVKRDDRGVIALVQNRKKKTEFRFTVLLGSPEANKICIETMTKLLPPGSPRVSRCRHFHTTRVNFALECPHDNGDFLKSLRLLRAYDDQIEQNRLQVDGTIELYNMSNIDENHVAEVAAVLSRCRLHTTASVVRSDPVHYEIPFFFEMLASTSLAQVLGSRKNKNGLVYGTHGQVMNLVYGIHQLFILPLQAEADEEIQIINLAEVNKTVTDAIIRQCAVEIHSLDKLPLSQFLHPVIEETDDDGLPAKYYGLVPYKITGKSAQSAFLDAMFGAALGLKSKKDEDEARLSRMLCSIVIKAVRVRQLHQVEQL
jgi:hypothetical protein